MTFKYKNFSRAHPMLTLPLHNRISYVNPFLEIRLYKAAETDMASKTQGSHIHGIHLELLQLESY